MVKYVECPRDSWQGLSGFIPTEEKIAYLQALLEAGFLHLDMGSFVSPKAVPQMADTEEVLAGLKPPKGADLLCIIANKRGLDRAMQAAHVTSVGFPLSINETFQMRNTNQDLKAAWALLKDLRDTSDAAGLNLVVYLSMGFGNPYKEPWQAKDTQEAVKRLRELNIQRIVLADTIGTASPERLQEVLSGIVEPERLGLHLHARPDAWQEQIDSALKQGIRWFEGALAGIGGCPFATDELLGNLPSELLLSYLSRKGFNVPTSKPDLLTQAANFKRYL